MKKIDSYSIVCDAQLAWELVSIGIKKIGFYCYAKRMNGDAVEWEYQGEYDPFDTVSEVIPAWTYEEIAIMIGGDLPIATLPEIKEFAKDMNMNAYYIYTDEKRLDFRNGASANAKLLLHYILTGAMSVELANERLEAFSEGDSWNPLDSDNYKKLNSKRRVKR